MKNILKSYQDKHVANELANTIITKLKNNDSSSVKKSTVALNNLYKTNPELAKRVENILNKKIKNNQIKVDKQ